MLHSELTPDQRATLAHIQDISSTARKRAYSDELNENAVSTYFAKVMQYLGKAGAALSAQLIFQMISQLIGLIAEKDTSGAYTQRLMLLLKRGSAGNTKQTQQQLNQHSQVGGRIMQQESVVNAKLRNDSDPMQAEIIMQLAELATSGDINMSEVRILIGELSRQEKGRLVRTLDNMANMVRAIKQ